MASYQVGQPVARRASGTPLANGLYLAAGGLGALAATRPSTRDARHGLAHVSSSDRVGHRDHRRRDRRSRRIPRRWPASWGERPAGSPSSRASPNSAVPAARRPSASAPGRRSRASGRSAGCATSRAIRPGDRMVLTAMAVALTVGSAAGGMASILAERAGFHLRHVILGNAMLFILAQTGLLLMPARGLAGVLDPLRAHLQRRHAVLRARRPVGRSIWPAARTR